MDLIRLCIQRPVGVSVGVLLVCLFGVLALTRIPVQLTPNVDVTVVTVTTDWFGASPNEIERGIIDRQEERLRNVQGLLKMTSTSNDNQGVVTLEFYPGVTKDEALRDVADKLRQVTGYPIEVEEPSLQAVDRAVDDPIAWLILYPADPNEPIAEQRDFVEDFVKPYLDRVPGVGSVDIYGGVEREVRVAVDAGQLAARGVTYAQVVQALRGQNTNISAGTAAQGKRDFTVRTVGEYESLEEVLSTVIAYGAGGPVYVRDIARVTSDYKEATSLVRSKGSNVLALPVRREVGSNVVAVMKDVRAAVERVNTEVLRARNMELELTQVYDETIYITAAIQLVYTNILFGGALASIVLLVFLRSVRATLVVALSIPISVVGTFLAIVALGRTLNVISLAGIAFAVGMVVDAAIVVLENIYRHRQMGKSAVVAALDGTREVWAAVLASTLTTMAVFIPVIFIEQEAGQLFRDISIATAAAVFLSMLVSITVIPPLASRLLARSRVRTSSDDPNAATGPLQRAFGTIAGVVQRLPGGRLAVAGSISALVVVLAPQLVPATTYLPAGNRNLVFGFLITPPGYSVDEFRRMARVVEFSMAPYWTAQPGSADKAALDQAWVSRVRDMIEANAIQELGDLSLSALERDRTRREWLTPPPLLDNFFFVAFNGGCFMGASSRDPARVRPLVRLLESAGGQVPGVFPVFFQTELFSFGGGNTAEIQIRGDNLDDVNRAALALQMACMREFQGFPQPSPTNFALGRPEVRFQINRERAADLGLNVADVGLIVEAAVDGAYVGDYRVAGGDTIDISLYIQRGEMDAPASILSIPIHAPIGVTATLGACVEKIDTTAQEQINHVERQRAVTLTVRPPGAMPLETVIAKINDPETGLARQLRDAGEIPPGVLVSLTGNADRLLEARDAVLGSWEGFTLQSVVNLASGRFFLSVLIVYLLLCALYESWAYPFVIMFSVPLAVLGGLVGLWLCNVGTLLTTDQPVQQLDVLTFLGFVILVGTVVNNAILLVDQSLQNHRDHGMPRDEAIRSALMSRVRPVLMTTLTTVVGLLPLAVRPGAGSELYRGLAAVIVGGMVVSTIGTLIIVPAVMSLVMQASAWYSRLRSAEPALPSPRQA